MKLIDAEELEFLELMLERGTPLGKDTVARLVASLGASHRHVEALERKADEAGDNLGRHIAAHGVDLSELDRLREQNAALVKALDAERVGRVR